MKLGINRAQDLGHAMDALTLGAAVRRRCEPRGGPEIRVGVRLWDVAQGIEITSEAVFPVLWDRGSIQGCGVGVACNPGPGNPSR